MPHSRCTLIDDPSSSKLEFWTRARELKVSNERCCTSLICRLRSTLRCRSRSRREGRQQQQEEEEGRRYLAGSGNGVGK